VAASVVLVDTSAWVEFFNRPAGIHHASVAELLDLDRVAITGIIVAELLRGCRSEREASDVEEALAGVIRIELGFEDWLHVGRDLRELRSRGTTVSLSDASIVHAARRWRARRPRSRACAARAG
jgi:predicted nucleic acid-binding protein